MWEPVLWPFREDLPRAGRVGADCFSVLIADADGRICWTISTFEDPVGVFLIGCASNFGVSAVDVCS